MGSCPPALQQSTSLALKGYYRCKMPEVEGVNLDKTRKSSLITVGKTTGQRKKSFVSFEEKSETIGIREEKAYGKEEGEEETMEEEEEGDVLSRLRSEKEGEVTGEAGGDGEEDEDDEVVAYSRRWTDSLKINRKKSKQEQEEKGKDSG